jgi:hypothetical protein
MLRARLGVCVPALVVALFVVGGATASAAPPAVYSVSYVLHEDPNDPASPETFRVILDLEYVEQVGSTTYWDLVGAEFRQPDGSDERVWYDPMPVTGTRLWAVEQADPDKPAPSDFADRPALAGFATALGDYADLDYDFSSRKYVTPPAAPYVDAVQASYWLQLDGESTPEQEGDDEPAEPVEDSDAL